MFCSINTRMSAVEIMGRDNDNTMRVCGCDNLEAVGYSFLEAVAIVCNLKNRLALDGFVLENQRKPLRNEVESLIN